MPEYITIMIAYLFDALGFGVARHRSILSLGLAAVAVLVALGRVFIGHHHVGPVAGLVAAALTVVFTRWVGKWLAHGGNALVWLTLSDAGSRFAWWVGGLGHDLVHGLVDAVRTLLPSPAPAPEPIHAVSCRCETCAPYAGLFTGSRLATERDYLRDPGETAPETPAYGPLRLVPALPPVSVETYEDWLPRSVEISFTEGVRIAAGYGVPRSTFARHRAAQVARSA